LLDVEGRVVVLHQQSLDLVPEPGRPLLVVVVAVVLVRVSVSLGSDLMNRLGKDHVLVDDVVTEELPHNVLSEGREQEDLELHGQLFERVGGGQKGGNGGVSAEDGVVLGLGLFGRELVSDGAGFSDL
jgi:hypothetical protein